MVSSNLLVVLDQFYSRETSTLSPDAAQII